MPPVVHLRPSPDLVLFVSCVEGKPVTRLPMPGRPRGATVLIGASRERDRTVYRPEEVVGLAAEEVRGHGKVYERTIAEGNLVRRTRADYDAWIAKIRDKKKAVQAGGES